LRILLIHPHIFAGGAEKAIVHLAHNLNKLGHEAAVCTLSARLDELPPIAKEVPYILPESPMEPLALRSIKDAFQLVLKEVEGLRKLLKVHAERFDVLSPCNFPAYWATYAFRRRKPIVWLSNEPFGPYNASRDIYDRSVVFRLAFKAAAFLDKRIVKQSVNEIVACSARNSRLIKQCYGLKAKVIPTGVDFEFFNQCPKNAKEALGLKDSYILLHVGAFMKRKNQLLSIRALSRLKKDIPNAKLILVGKGPWEEALKLEVQRLGLNKDVIFAGKVREEELRLLYHACDLNLFPVQEQTHGLVPFEALSAGKLSLVSSESGAAELAKELFYLIKPTVDSIVKGVLEVYKHPEKFKELLNKGKDYVKMKLDWKNYARKIAQIYMEYSRGI
jgi:glycosyltransferase involved in cell wall biosynthesis